MTKPILPLVCIFGCDKHKDPVVCVIKAPEGCTCAGNIYQPRCYHHLMRLYDSDEGCFEIVEDFRIYPEDKNKLLGDQ